MPQDASAAATGAAISAAPAKPIDGWQPSSFLERGIAVPFTTPHLAGARLRPGARSGFELIVPSLAGARGVYIMPWDAVPSMCSPSLHDRRLFEVLARMPILTPAAIRRAARDVAAEGLAGREALAAAAAAQETETNQCLLANLELLLELVRQVEPQGPDWVPPERVERDVLEQRARAAITLLGRALGSSSDAVTTMIEELAALFGPVGIGRTAAAARVPTLIGSLRALGRDMHAWPRDPGEPGAADAALIEAGADLAVTGGETLLREARAMLGELPKLLRRWANGPEPVVRAVSRAEWLLDGWERICLLWQVEDENVSRVATLAEMAELVPATPREASDWVEDPLVEHNERLRHRRQVMLGEDWRTGVTLLDLALRNERMREQAPA